MVRRANQAGLNFTIRDVFEHPTVAELARRIRTRRPASGPKPPSTVYVTIDSLRNYGRDALERAGLVPEGAAVVTEVQLEASLRGQPTHNVDGIPRYARRLRAGSLNGDPRIRIEHEMRISARVDGDNGPGQWIATVAMETAIRKARESGIGVVTVRRSNHFGAAGHYVWTAARQGLIGLCTTNGPAVLAPTGGRTPILGNNPIGAGIPAGRHPPILLDVAMSVAPRGKIGLHLAEGRPLPPGWILDRFGRPSTNVEDLAAGLGVPIGGHKGYGLALILEVLSGVLSGAGFGADHRMRRGSGTFDVGHLFIAIDPALFSPAEEFKERVDRLIEQIQASEPIEGVSKVLIPGEAEMRSRERHLAHGVPLRQTTYRALIRYGKSSGLKSSLVEVPPPP
jgi:LDH2 family malate/lactate/ureidoglycolate dehydrogenase